MSTLYINYDDVKFPNLPNDNSFHENLIQATVETLNKKPEEVILYFYTLESQNAVNSPSILIKAETSSSRKNLLKSWGEALHKILLVLVAGQATSVAVKPYVIDSEWIAS